MAKSKKSKSRIIQGGISIVGNAEIKNSKVGGRDINENNIVNINISFAPVYHAIKESTTIPLDTKKTLEQNVKQIETEIKKENEAKPSFIQKRLENIQKMAPEILEVVIASLQNPAAGIGLAVKKVINKFEAETNK